jgi:hypothetical protein
MAKTTARFYTETGSDGKPVEMIEVIEAAPTPSAGEIRKAIEVHELALVTAIKDSAATYGEGRILMLIQTIEALKRMES